MYLREQFKIYHSLLITTVLLVGFGVIMVYSASGISSGEKFHDPYYFLKREILWATVGFSLLFLISRFDYHYFAKISKPLLLFSIFLFVLLFSPLGVSAGGARRWLRIGPLTLQPSELAKLAVVVYLAEFLSRKRKKITEFATGFLPPLILLAPFVIFLLWEPDLGTAILILMVSFLLLFIAGAKLSYLCSLFLCSLPAFFLFIYKSPYRRARILTFFQPCADPQGIGYQINQSLIALGSGGILGKGLGKGAQKLFFLPESHTDFIFSIVGEELGIFGTLFLLFLFTFLICQGKKLAQDSRDAFGYFLATGITLMIGLGAILHIGVAMGVFPAKGTPLPLVSYGGSALVVSLMAIGILLNISTQLEEKI